MPGGSNGCADGAQGIEDRGGILERAFTDFAEGCGGGAGDVAMAGGGDGLFAR